MGRRGSGKTALSQFFSFQKQLRNTVAIDVDEPVAFEQILEKVSKLTMHSREVAIPKIAKIWDFLIWLIIFHELKDQDMRIRATCIFGDKNGKVSSFIRHTLSALVNHFLETEGDLLGELEAILSDERIAAGKAAVLEMARKKPIIGKNSGVLGWDQRKSRDQFRDGLAQKLQRRTTLSATSLDECQPVGGVGKALHRT